MTDGICPVSRDKDRVRGPQHHPSSSSSLERFLIMVYYSKKTHELNEGKSCMEHCPEDTMLSHGSHTGHTHFLQPPVVTTRVGMVQSEECTCHQPLPSHVPSWQRDKAALEPYAQTIITDTKTVIYYVHKCVSFSCFFSWYL